MTLTLLSLFYTDNLSLKTAILYRVFLGAYWHLPEDCWHNQLRFHFLLCLVWRISVPFPCFSQPCVLVTYWNLLQSSVVVINGVKELCAPQEIIYWLIFELLECDKASLNPIIQTGLSAAPVINLLAKPSATQAHHPKALVAFQLGHPTMISESVCGGLLVKAIKPQRWTPPMCNEKKKTHAGIILVWRSPGYGSWEQGRPWHFWGPWRIFCCGPNSGGTKHDIILWSNQQNHLSLYRYSDWRLEVGVVYTGSHHWAHDVFSNLTFIGNCCPFQASNSFNVGTYVISSWIYTFYENT